MEPGEDRLSGLRDSYQHALSLLDGLGPLGPLAYIPLYLIGTLLLIPGPFLMFAGGALFGFTRGLGAALVASLFSAAVHYFAGRYLSRQWMLKKIATHEKMGALDDAVAQGGWRMVALLRLTALVPFAVMNYALGLSKIRFRAYLPATALGLLPSVLLYVYLGSLAGKMAIALEADKPRKGATEWILFAVGLAVSAVMSVRATKIVKKALRESP